jgi:carbonic anhydrase
MFSPDQKNILQTIPEGQRPVATRLMNGSDTVYAHFRLHADLMHLHHRQQAALKAGKPIRSVRYALEHQSLSLQYLFKELARDVSGSWRDYRRHENLSQPTNLQDGQAPLFAGYGCSDSRVDIVPMLKARAGQVFVGKNVGGSMENPRDPQKLSDDAKEFLTYSNILGIKDFIYFTHGKCGCIAHAANDNQDKPFTSLMNAEEKTLAKMYHRKDHIRARVEKEGVAHHLAKLSDHGSRQLIGAEARLTAMELTHGQHCAALARDFITTLPTQADGGRMRVTLVHMDLRTLNVYMHTPQTDQFVRLTNHPPLKTKDQPQYGNDNASTTANTPSRTLSWGKALLQRFKR